LCSKDLGLAQKNSYIRANIQSSKSSKVASGLFGRFGLFVAPMAAQAVP
jgi:hypothetical protein